MKNVERDASCIADDKALYTGFVFAADGTVLSPFFWLSSATPLGSTSKSNATSVIISADHAPLAHPTGIILTSMS